MAAISQASCVHCFQTALSVTELQSALSSQGCTLLCHPKTARCPIVTGLHQR